MENEKNKMKHSIKNKRGRNKKGKKYGKEADPYENCTI